MQTRLAYVRTGVPAVDEVSHAGLSGLSRVLQLRTSIEAAAPLGVDLIRDELAFFPLLYWPIVPQQRDLTEIAVRKLNDYMRNGGTILFDLREVTGGARIMGRNSRAGVALQRLTRGLDIPPLAPVPPDHVVTRSFYLMQEFPGRYSGGTLWIEATEARINDGVTPVLIGSNDWAGAWAINDTSRPMFAVVPGGERQRELAYRFGVNLAMYAMTGNYKGRSGPHPLHPGAAGPMTGALSLAWAPLFPWPVVGLLATAALIVVGFALWRRARGTWWRALALGTLVLALANPSLVREERDPLDDIALVVVDESPSQAIAPRGQQNEAAAAHLLEALGRLPGTETRLVRAGAAAAGIEEDGTRLFAALRQALSKVPRQRVAGVVFISDGQIHDVPENLEALGLDAPLHLLLTGAGPRDGAFRLHGGDAGAARDGRGDARGGADRRGGEADGEQARRVRGERHLRPPAQPSVLRLLRLLRGYSRLDRPDRTEAGDAP